LQNKKEKYLLNKFLISIFFACCSVQIYAGQLSAGISTGYEKITSPLVRIDIDAPLLLVEGRSKLTGQYYQFGASGFYDWDLGRDYSYDLSASTSIKQAPNAEDLNFSIVSVDTAFRKKIGEISLGIGAAVQRTWVANSEFRDSLSLQSDLTYTKANGSFTNVYLGVSKNYFADEFEFFDSQSATLSLTQHTKDIGLGFSALDLQLSASRDKNIRNSDDLSNYACYGRVSLDKKMLGLTWSAGASITKSYFDAPFFDGFAKREDSYISYEFGVEREFSDTLKMSLDFNKAKNKSNLVLFESDYRAVNLTLNYTF
jgi:hypothetical protein